ncbi:hypothetical protein HCC36_16115 [Listeria booriae]|uniref:Uncharacterized protein n=1 Tax=Listeria booriae TaxID=1552123 RepID=A0A842G396_9LIST|nr:hypothetical protein [Listeria booriae]MBC2294749.1 hypothetical protein [Listeria booriae]
MKSNIEDSIQVFVDQVRDTLRKNYLTLNERGQQDALAFFEKQLRKYIENIKDKQNRELDIKDVYSAYEHAWLVVESYLNGKGKLVLIDLETFTLEYRHPLSHAIKQDGKMLDFIFQHEKPYVKRLYDKLKESYDLGEDVFYHRESELEFLAEECMVFRLGSYKKEFEQL